MVQATVYRKCLLKALLYWLSFFHLLRLYMRTYCEPEAVSTVVVKTLKIASCFIFYWRLISVRLDSYLFFSFSLLFDISECSA